MIEIIHEVTLQQFGTFKRVRRWVRGIHPERGKILHGLTGWETVEEADVVLPLYKFFVIDLTPSLVKFDEIT